MLLLGHGRLWTGDCHPLRLANGVNEQTMRGARRSYFGARIQGQRLATEGFARHAEAGWGAHGSQRVHNVRHGRRLDGFES